MTMWDRSYHRKKKDFSRVFGKNYLDKKTWKGF